jgi:BlaI family transcriptional regulator, penicillinase repressor
VLQHVTYAGANHASSLRESAFSGEVAVDRDFAFAKMAAASAGAGGGGRKWKALMGKPDCGTPSPVRRLVALRPGQEFEKGHRQMNDSLPELGDLEREVMQLVWAGGPVTAEAVRERLSRPLKESTVRTVLRRLEEKGYTTHTVDGRTYVYQAAEPRGRVAAKAVQRVVDWFCNGSVEEVLVGMVDTAMLDQRQLRMLADKVAKAKANEKAKAKGGKK